MGKQSNLIYFDLLYKQKKYADLLEQFGILKEHLNAKQLPITRSIYVLVFATCYCQVNGTFFNSTLFCLRFFSSFINFCPQNTDVSFEYAKQLHDQYSKEHITQEHLIFLSALAIDQNAPNVANELLQQLWSTAHQAIPSLRLNALMQMRKFLDALQMLRSILVVFDNNRSQKDELIALEVVSTNTHTQKNVHFIECPFNSSFLFRHTDQWS